MGSNAAGDDPKSIIVDAGADKKQEGGASQSASKQPGHNSDADPVHGATGTPRPMTKKEVSDEAENVKESGKIPDLKDLHDNFHSARSDKHRASLKGDEEQMPPIPYSTGLTTQQAEELLKVHGRNELVENAKPMWKLFVEQFTAPMPIGIWIAMIVELSLENWTDAVILFVLQCINGTVGFTEARKAGNAVAALKATVETVAQVKRDGQWQTIHAALLVPGDCVTLSSGSAVQVRIRALGIDLYVPHGLHNCQR